MKGRFPKRLERRGTTHSAITEPTGGASST